MLINRSMRPKSTSIALVSVHADDADPSTNTHRILALPKLESGNPVTDGDSLAALYKGAVWPSQHNQTHNNMGNFFQKMAKVFSDFGGSKKSRVVMVGLDAAGNAASALLHRTQEAQLTDPSGKTTILYKLKLNEAVRTIPTIGL